MALETGTYISDLVSTNPAGTDTLDKADDHLRLIKSTVKATFPNIAGAVTPTHTELNFVDGVTSAIQAQLDTKAPLASPTFTGVAAVQAGSAALPSLIPTGDTNTGIWFPAADTIAVSTAGGERVRIDSSGNVTVNGSGGLGYGTGSGGTVTQITSKATSVTLSKTNGKITMNNAALAAGATATFSVTNTTVALTDTVILSVSANTIAGTNYRVELVHVTGGGFTVRVTNISAGSLSEALEINFAVIKAVTS